MSGGTWDYVGWRIKTSLFEIVDEEKSPLKTDCPKLADSLERLGEAIQQIEHDLDWYYEGDTLIENMEVFQEEALAKLRQAIAWDEHK